MSAPDRDALLREVARDETRLAEIESERRAVTARLEELRAELAVIPATSATPLAQHPLVLPTARTPQSSHEKMELFRALFRGRTDVFPKHWQNARTKKKGYSPACSNEWVRGVCDKPRVKCYITGLTATPQRRDGHHPISEYQLGPVRFSIDPKSDAARRPFAHQLIVRETTFRLPNGSTKPGIQEIYGLLATDGARNELILNDVVRALEEGRSPLLLTERRDHVDFFAERLQTRARHLVILQGGMGVKQRREVIEMLASIPDDEERLVLATGRFIGEGFDDARLDTLFLALPVSWKGTLVQYAGRLHRQHRAKTDVRVFDYVDRQVPMLARMFDKRMRGYRSMGYETAPGPDLFPSDTNELVIEYDQEALREMEADPF